MWIFWVRKMYLLLCHWKYFAIIFLFRRAIHHRAMTMDVIQGKKLSSSFRPCRSKMLSLKIEHTPLVIPHPSRGVIEIQVWNKPITWIMISNALGQPVRRDRLENRPVSKFSDSPDGMYIVSIWQGDGKHRNKSSSKANSWLASHRKYDPEWQYTSVALK